MRYSKLACYLLFFTVAEALSGQNTEGGKLAIVPEAEVNRQSEFLNAERERLLGHYDKALSLYEKFTRDYPENDAAWYGLARTYTAKKETEKAIIAIQKAVKLDEKNIWYLIFFADLLEQTGKIRHAAQIYQTLTRNHSGIPEFFQKLAYLETLSANPKEALKALEKVEQLQGISEETSRSKHLIYVGMGDMKHAAAELQRLAEAFPDEVAYWYEWADFLEKTADRAAAKKVYERILKRRPDDPVARLAVLDKPKNASAASQLQLRRALFADPGVEIDAKVKEILPLFDVIGKQTDAELVSQLLGIADDLTRAHPDEPKAWSLAGDLFYHLDHPQEAMQRYQRCIGLSPAVFSVWANLMDLLAEQKDYAGLLNTSEKAIDAFPNQPLGYLNYGYAANHLGQHDAALQLLQQGILMTGNNQPLRLDFTSQIGWALNAKKEFETARNRLEATLGKGGEKHTGVLQRLADAYEGLGQKEKAAEFRKKAEQ